MDSVARLPDLLRRAFRAATTGAPGPVHLRMQSHPGQMTEEEADLDPLVEEAFQRAPAFRPEPEMARVRAAIALLTDLDFAKIAEACGCAEMRVEKPGELKGALARASAMNRPVVVDVVTDMYAIAPHPWTPTGGDFHSYQRG